MKVSKGQAVVLRDAIDHWSAEGALDPGTAARLRDGIEVAPFDWRRLTKYSFWVAIICIVTAISSALADKVLMEMLEALFNASAAVKLLGLSALSAAIYAWGLKRRRAYPEKSFSNEAILFLGVLTTAGAVYQLGRLLDTGSGHFSLLLLLSFFVYGALGWFFGSNLIWLFALISLGGWMGTETGYMSGWGAYYLGMNYPLRFVFFGALLIAVTVRLERVPGFQPFYRSTLAMGLLDLFIALWLMSIFGNYAEGDGWWSRAGHLELFAWSALFAIAAGGAIWHGLRFDNGMTKGFGITFLFINLYTRFFEYFWSGMHKAIFFAILGASFWWVGSRAERIWNVGGRKTLP